MNAPKTQPSHTSDETVPCRLETSFTRLPHSACIWPGVQDYDKSINSNSGDNNNIQISNEFVTARRVNGLHNAANRGRPNSFDELGFCNDDSIIGENTTLDLTDGVDLRTKRLEMSFSFLDAASLMFSMTSFFLDMVTDIAVATFHYLNNDYWYCALTIAFIILPTLVTTCVSLRWYIVDSQLEGTEPVSRTQWIIRFIFHILQVGPILRYYESLQYGLEFRKTVDLEEKKKIYMKMIYEDADATMLRLFESFMESAPQLMLQMYIITKNYPFDDYEYWTTCAQVISIASSLISISWSLVSYSKSLRISLPNKVPMTYCSIAIMFSWEFFSITARMIVLALFTSAFVRYVGLVCLVHWLIMTSWILTMKTNFCNTKCEEFGFNGVLGIIFIFCYFNPVDNATRYRYLTFYIFMFVENSTLLVFWLKKVDYEIWVKELVIYTHYTSFVLGILLMLTYYRWFHPTGGIRIFKNQGL